MKKADYMSRYQNTLLDYVQELAAKMTDLHHEQDVLAAFKEPKGAGGRSSGS
jgi:hypothetical protein